MYNFFKLPKKIIKRCISHDKLLGLVQDLVNYKLYGICNGIAHTWGVKSFILNEQQHINEILKNLNLDTESVKKYLKENKLKITSDFNSIILHQNPMSWLLEKLVTEGYTHDLYFELEKLPIQNEMEVWQRVQPAEIEKQGGIAKAEKTIIGAYNIDELKIFFQGFIKVMEDNGVTDRLPLILGNINHTIKIGYDHDTKRWIGVDANQLPIQFNLTTEEIAYFVMKGLSIDNIAIFSTSMYSTQFNNENLNKINKAWLEEKKVKAIHKITSDKIKIIDSNGANLLHIAIREGDLRSVQAILQLGGNLYQRTINDRTPLDMIDQCWQNRTEMLEFFKNLQCLEKACWQVVFEIFSISDNTHERNKRRDYVEKLLVTVYQDFINKKTYKKVLDDFRNKLILDTSLEENCLISFTC
jgi:hypothetical protein